MATIKRFEDLVAWQKADALSKLVNQVSDRPAWNRDWGLRGQIRESANSVAANIAEGFNSGLDGEFRRYLRIAKSSAGETRNHAYKAAVPSYLTADEQTQICELSVECEKLIQGLINYLTKALAAKS